MNSDVDRAYRAAWHRRRRHKIMAGTWQPMPLVDPGPSIRHLHWLRSLGISPDGCAEACNVASGTIHHVLYTMPPRRILQASQDAILACRHPLDTLPDRRHIGSIGSRRRVQALAVAGWPRALLASRMGISTTALSAMIRRDRLTARNARTIRALHDELAMHPGPSDITRSRAIRDGWTPALAWDDDIDDPAASPDLGVDDPEEDTRLVVEAVAWGLSTGQGWGAICASLGKPSLEALQRSLQRVGRHDLSRALTAREAS